MFSLFCFLNNHIFVFVHTFLPSLFAVKQDIPVTIFVRCMCVHVCIWICLGHNSYIYAWIYKLFGTVVVLEEKCHLKHFYSETERFGGYSDEPGIRLSSVRTSVRKHFRVRSIT